MNSRVSGLRHNKHQQHWTSPEERAGVVWQPARQASRSTEPRTRMDPRRVFVDERHTGVCAYCGAQPDARDHIPPKVPLDEPLHRSCLLYRRAPAVTQASRWMSSILPASLNAGYRAPLTRRPSTRERKTQSYRESRVKGSNCSIWKTGRAR